MMLSPSSSIKGKTIDKNVKDSTMKSILKSPLNMKRKQSYSDEEEEE
jgi:hypothetical protein